MQGTGDGSRRTTLLQQTAVQRGRAHKDASPEAPRAGSRGSAGRHQAHSPFNERNIYDGGRTIFLHDAQLQQAIAETFGQKVSLTKATADDLRILEVLDGLPRSTPS